MANIPIQCVADHFNRPLYMISCGDIGTTPAVVEKNLEEIFQYAVKWQAVLLMDRADIFLQERYASWLKIKLGTSHDVAPELRTGLVLTRIVTNSSRNCQDLTRNAIVSS